MKRVALLAGILGLTLFGVLIAVSGLDDVGEAVRATGWAALLIVLLRIVALVGAGIAWNWLYPVAGRLGSRISILLRFVREGVNQLLPVGAVGGDVVGARLATFWGADGALAGAVTIADVALQAATQFGFALVGAIILLCLKGNSEMVDYVIGGLLFGAALVACFFVVQARVGSRLLTALLRRLGHTGKGQDLVDRLWHALGGVYAGPGRVAAAAALHLSMWFVGALEVYVALHAMGYPISYADAVVIESLGQAARGAAFAVPGGLGVQEGGFIALCALFAIPAGPAVALSLVKRIADVALGLPGILIWQILEGRRAFAAARP